MKGFLLAALAAAPIILLAGCGNAAPPLSGGRPVSYWVQALDGRDARTRRTAAARLGNAGPADPQVLPALMKALHDAEPGVRSEAIVALVKLGPPAREALPALATLQRGDHSAAVRACAGRALAKLEADDGGP